MVPESSSLYKIILADPPWKYDFSKTKNRKVENHYPTMTVDEIAAIKVPAADNAVLYLWATAPKLREALIVMKRWGFEYKSNSVWDKEIQGMGYWFRGQHEHLLVGIKGQFSPPAVECRVSSVIRSRRTKHSEKPIEVHEMIDMAWPDFEKLEMFARRKGRPNWSYWGNEVKSDVSILPELPDPVSVDPSCG